MRLNSTVLAAALSLALLSGCTDASKAWLGSRLTSFDAAAIKVAELAPKYCRIRPQTSLDDLALAGIALATSEKAADTIKAAVDKVCSWVGEPVEKQAGG